MFCLIKYGFEETQWLERLTRINSPKGAVDMSQSLIDGRSFWSRLADRSRRQLEVGFPSRTERQ